MDPEPAFTVFIRLPFPRGDFVDPPPVNWDASKDDALWNTLSGAAQTDINWSELASRFQVTVDFLVQQATYLTERHASQVRAQMRRATAAKGSTSSAAHSPNPGSDSGTVASEAMRRTGSGGGGRAPSSLSVRRDSPLPKSDLTVAGTGSTGSKSSFARPQVSRNSSTNTMTQRVASGSSPRPDRASVGPNSPRTDTHRRRLSSLPITTTAGEASGPMSPGPADSDSGEESSSSSSVAESRIIRRPPRYQPHQDEGASPGLGDDEAEPAFLPPSAHAGGSYQDPGATLKGEPHSVRSRKDPTHERVHQSQTSDSSSSSAAPAPARKSGTAGPSGPLSPRRTAELSGRSPAAKGKGVSRDGSDGTPSMGSSFSDLDGEWFLTFSSCKKAPEANIVQQMPRSHSRRSRKRSRAT
ncbi:uncharacterized protein E0L32_005458 [Thyridium curvatum]|uniref:Autophagy-related protein 29 n=1 Tax=Thyridium curvatum TaxID=1093900 RepID=A0A507B775_9PEZI|nr:uncharacterized protein E0L32_005458 [Thyridium curvatum]TPX14494.1 hypothetical protein E0L32_005458 [Thyridium curvatum]